jgi:pimeloyl-ACP methyl ester carboxylesterase
LGIADGRHRRRSVARALQSDRRRERILDHRCKGSTAAAAAEGRTRLVVPVLFSTARGELGYSKNRYAFDKLIWTIVSPKWHFDDATYDRTAAAFDNPDHVAIVIHNYRWRLGLAKGDPKYDSLEAKLFAGPVIEVPAITIASDFDGAAASGTAYRSKFAGKYSHRILTGIGHNVPQEAPSAFADAVVTVDHY